MSAYVIGGAAYVINSIAYVIGSRATGGSVGASSSSAISSLAQMGNPNRDTSQKAIRHVDAPNRAFKNTNFSFGEEN